MIKQMIRKSSPRSLVVLVSALAICGCTNLATGDLERKFAQTVRDRGLTPVYPPREELQVGDVFYVQYNPNAQNDLSQTSRAWLGTLQSVLHLGNDYLKTRINYPSTQTEKDGSAVFVKRDQADLSSGTVTVNAQGRDSLPIISFPAVSGRASSAGALGGYGYLRSFGIGLGRSETVNLDFGDTRAFGAPESALQFSDAFNAEFRTKMCPRLQTKLIENVNAGETDAQGNPITKNVLTKCPDGKACAITVISRTIMTRKLTYSYSNARIGRLAANILRSEPSLTNPEPLPIPGNLNVDLTVGENASTDQLDTLVAGLTTNLNEAKVDGAETAGLNFVGVRGSSLVFERVFNKPVAVAYEGLLADPKVVLKEACGVEMSDPRK